jgi:hypothetical protein
MLKGFLPTAFLGSSYSRIYPYRWSTKSPGWSGFPSVLHAFIEEWKEQNVAAVISYRKKLGEILARLDRGGTLLHLPGLHDAALSQRVNPLAE